MNDVATRQARAEDSELVYRIKEAAFREYVEKVWGWDEAEQRRLHARRFLPANFLVLQVSGTDVGILAIYREAGVLHVRQLFVLPEYQGRGIGKSCMLQTIQDAEAQGLAIRLQVLKVNPRAHSFYERLGFKVIGENETHEQMERHAMASPST